jgi:lauroyl/myristoyl acyltransferase
MILPTLLALFHGDDTGIQLLYFWAAVLLALTPLLIFGTIGVWVARMIWKERRKDEVRNAEFEMRN